ncbi:MAG: aminoacyl-tRNA hydrolase [bacterium]
MPLLAGLGNPGRAYRDTPHNIGFAVVEVLAARAGAEWRRGRGRSRVAKALYATPPVVFLKPYAYMNRSGAPIEAALKRYGIPPSELFVICDDVNLPLGQLRMRLSGSAGGHKGLLSILEELETEAFARLRIGVGGGDPGADLAAYVLRKFAPALRDRVRQVIDRAADAAECFLREGGERAMNQFNRDWEETKPL